MERLMIAVAALGLLATSGCCKKAMSPSDRTLVSRYATFTKGSFAEALAAKGLEQFSPPIVSRSKDGDMDGEGEAPQMAPLSEDQDRTESPPEQELVTERYSESEGSPSYEFVRNIKSGRVFRLRREPRRIAEKTVTICGCTRDSWGKGITPSEFEVAYHIPDFGGLVTISYDEKMVLTVHSDGACPARALAAAPEPHGQHEGVLATARHRQ